MAAEPPPADQVTVLLNAESTDGRGAIDRLLPLVYDQLRQTAQANLATERPSHTLSATVLVHEAYLRLVGPRQVPWQNRAHFYAAAAQAMRRILVDHARAKAAAKRGGGEDRSTARRAALELANLPDLADVDQSAGFLILEDALSRLERVDEQAASVVRLRYFAGLSIEDTAAALGVSSPTVKRTWAFARAWLREAIERDRD